MKKILVVFFLCVLAIYYAHMYLTAYPDYSDDEEIIISAEQGDADGQYRLGNLYYYGHGVEMLYDVALEWFEKAAKQGHAEAQYLVGGFHFRGTGMEKEDYAVAKEWYEKAAAQGHAEAQFALGGIYAFGSGVPQDHIVAKEWYGLACYNGSRNGCDMYKEFKTAGYEDYTNWPQG